MSDIYSTLSLSPKKKRCASTLDDGTLTPKKMRLAPLTPPPTQSRKQFAEASETLPLHLSRLNSLHTALLHALSHALASCAVSPSSDTGIVRNVLKHVSLSNYAGLSAQFTVDDLRRLCWVWEWDGKKKVDACTFDDEDNPFLDTPSPSKDWKRGAGGIIISPATQFSKVEGKRVSAYGIGIEVEMDIDKDMGGGMAAVARWTAATETRRAIFRDKLQAWVALHPESNPVPKLPLADLPPLNSPTKPSSLTRVFASVSPKASSSTSLEQLHAPSSPTRSPLKSPKKRALQDFAIPFPITPSSRSASPTKSSVLFPSTPSRSGSERLLNSRTPKRSDVSVTDAPSEPSTPRGRDPSSVLQTPTTSRRQALYERIRQRSLSASPSKSQRNEDSSGNKLSRDEMLKLGQEEMRRRCLLGRLGGVAESVWMLFATPTTGSSTTPTTRKRRALPISEVATAIIKSSPVPISAAEANESLGMLTKLCPFFLKRLNLSGEEWLEMPSSIPTTSSSSVTSQQKQVSSSPGKQVDSEHELITRSPRRVKREAGGLREVREIIRREMELHD